MKTRSIAILLTFVLLMGTLSIMPIAHAADTVTVWDEQFTSPYPYTLGETVSVTYNTNQDATVMGKFYRHGNTCNIKYTALAPNSSGVPAFPDSGYVSSGKGNILKVEYPLDGLSVPANGITYRTPTTITGDKIALEFGIHIENIRNYGANSARWFLIYFGQARLKLYNSGSGAATSGPIKYQTKDASVSGDATGVDAGVNWSSGWHKIKIELLKNSPSDTVYNRANYYYDNMTTPINAEPVTITDVSTVPQPRFYMGARSTETTAPAPIYFDYIKVTAENSNYTSTLPAMAKPVWNNNIITWTSQANTSGYEVTLYKNSEEYESCVVASNVNKYNFTNTVITDLSAQWTVTIKALGIKDNSKIVCDSPVSPMSEACTPIEIRPLDTPSTPTWDSGSGIASWNNVANNCGYSVKLYKNGTLVGTYSTAADENSINLSSYMEINGNGTYTVKVIALGDDGDSCMDSSESGLSSGHSYTVPTIEYNRVLIDQGFNAPPYNVTSLGTPEWNINAEVNDTAERGLMLRDGKFLIAHGQGTPWNNIVRSIMLDGNFEGTTARYVEYEGKFTPVSPGSQFYILLVGETADGTSADVGGFGLIGNELRPSRGMSSASVGFSPAINTTAGTTYDIRFRASKDAGASEDDPYTTIKWWVNGTERVTTMELRKTVTKITGVRFGTTTGTGCSWAVHPFTVKDNLINLGSMDAPEWGTDHNARTIYWDHVPNNRGYIITLYKEGVSSPLGEYIAPQNATSFDMEQALLSAGLGRVYVTIRAKGDGVYMISGPVSDRSDSYQIKSPELAPGPNATNVKVTAGLDGKSLVGSYVYRNTDASATEGNTTFRWLICDTEKGAYEPIPGETGMVYNLTSSDLSKFIRFEVTPRDNAGNVGDYVRSTASRPPVLPVAEDVTFTRNNDTLTGSYTYSHFAGTREGKTQFKWLISDYENGDYKAIPGATTATLKLKENQKLKYIKFEVTPGDSNGNQGYSYQSEGSIDLNPDTYAIVAASKLEPSSLTTEQPSRITKNLDLPSTGLHGATITWSSDKPGVISSTGVVKRPKDGASEVVTLTAKITVGGNTQTRTYKFIVLSLDVLGDGKATDPTFYKEFTNGSTSVNTELYGIFSDVSNSHWALPYITYLYERGILNGTGAGRFEPERAVSREEFCKILMGAFNMLNTDVAVQFKDVPGDAWYYTSVASAVANKIVFGKNDEMFGTGEVLTRQDMAVMMSRIVSATNIEIPQNTEYAEPADFESADEYARDGMKMLLSAGILSGDQNGCLNPKQPATRAEVAKIVYMLYKMN